MVFGRPLLIAFVAFLATAAAVMAAQPSCLHCHRSHYEQLGACTGCHRGNDRTERRAVAHHGLISGKFAHFTLRGAPEVERGKKLTETFVCRRCHRMAGKGNRLAADLDLLLAARTPEQLFASIKSPVLAMPDFHFDDRQIIDLVNAVLAGGTGGGVKGAETPQVVHFEDGTQSRENLFVRKCGPCHRALTEKFGGLGMGDTAPNLSGLFSGFYPRIFRESEPWNPDRLKKWLENPRSVRAYSRMRPVRLTGVEFEQLLGTMQVPDRR